MAVKTATAGAVLLGLPVALAVDVPLLAARAVLYGWTVAVGIGFAWVLGWATGGAR